MLPLWVRQFYSSDSIESLDSVFIRNLSFILGAVDENTELGMDFSTIKAQQLPPILHD